MPQRTIADVLKGIFQHDFILPAIQREFVWNKSQICRLFDSLMLGYPIGTFLTWKVPQERASDYVYYDFVREYHQKDNPYCPVLKPPTGKPLTAVLDGQQRLTALNIGLRGSHADKAPRLWWNNPHAFFVRMNNSTRALPDIEVDAYTRAHWPQHHEQPTLGGALREPAAPRPHSAARAISDVRRGGSCAPARPAADTHGDMEQARAVPEQSGRGVES